MTSIHFFHPIGKKLYRTLSKSIESDRNRSILIVVDEIIRGPPSDAYYEYAVYVTDLEREASQVRNLYNPRGDNENCYDELKNHWGWGGFTLHDLARSELMANLIALIYNLWSVYIKLVDPLVAREAITSRPMYLMHPAKVSTHQSQRTLRIFCAHSEMKQIQLRLEEASQRLKNWAQLTAEQLKQTDVWTRVIAHILLNHHTIGAGDSRAPPVLTVDV